jgi:hypothetical protein
VSGVEPPFEDGPSKFDAAFSEALQELHAKGFRPHTIVTPSWPIAVQRQAELLATMYNLKLLVDVHRPVSFGLGIQFEGSVPDMEPGRGESPVELGEGEEWKQ